MSARPTPDEYDPFYASYIGQVPERMDPVEMMEAQLTEVSDLLGSLTVAQGGHRYAEGKWSVREVVGHLADAERVFQYRMFRITRGDTTPLAGFDEQTYVAAAGADRRPMADLLDEWTATRRATLAFVRSVPDQTWRRRGTANNLPISARALLYITPGHVAHHLEVLRTRYGLGTGG